MRRLEFFGYVFGEFGMSADPRKVETIKNDEDKLTEWGTKAYKQILKPKPVSKDSSESDIICKLINFSGAPVKLPPKRSKKQTEKALLSKEQEDELEQPKAKKSKTNFHVQRKLLTELQSQFKRDDQPSNEKTRGHTQGTTAVGQTPDTRKAGGPKQQETGIAAGQIPDNKKDSGPKQQRNGIAAGQTLDTKKDDGSEQQETGIAAGKTPDNKKDGGPKQQRNGIAAGQTLDTKKDDGSEQQEAGIAAGQTPDTKKDGNPEQQRNGIAAGQTSDTKKDGGLKQQETGIAAGQTPDTKKDGGLSQQETGIAATDVHYGHSFWHTGVDQSD
ncbi:uncharacterized protein LOC123538666 [Mercenaria mercenaria]|uniref:uncharacterized protein LOC123538666 n=1 Tax=Mercenaria mercenaria TaxID=6596 RepID=UPI00234E657B|nr:uncharacterized protein LOC123538666 [Mercenaria mercenaria]